MVEFGALSRLTGNPVYEQVGGVAWVVEVVVEVAVVVVEVMEVVVSFLSQRQKLERRKKSKPLWWFGQYK